MAFIAATTDTSAPAVLPTTSFAKRFLSAIISARQAQAELRIAEQLRDHVPDHILRDLGLPRKR